MPFLWPGNYTTRVWEYSSTTQSPDDLPVVQGSSSFSLKGEFRTPRPPGAHQALRWSPPLTLQTLTVQGQSLPPPQRCSGTPVIQAPGQGWGHPRPTAHPDIPGVLPQAEPQSSCCRKLIRFAHPATPSPTGCRTLWPQGTRQHFREPEAWQAPPGKVAEGT